MSKSTGKNAEQTYSDILKENKGNKVKAKNQVQERLEKAKQEPNPWGRFMMFNFWNRVREFASK